LLAVAVVALRVALVSVSVVVVLVVIDKQQILALQQATIQSLLAVAVAVQVLTLAFQILEAQAVILFLIL
jgi:hypothetical protein